MAKRKPRTPQTAETPDAPKVPRTLEAALASRPYEPPRPEDRGFMVLVEALATLSEYDFEAQERERERCEADALVELEKLAVLFKGQQERELERRAKARQVRLDRLEVEKVAKLAEETKNMGKGGSRKPVSTHLGRVLSDS